MGIDVAPRLTIESVKPPEERKGGLILDNVDELIDKLRNEAKVIWAINQLFIAMNLIQI